MTFNKGLSSFRRRFINLRHFLILVKVSDFWLGTTSLPLAVFLVLGFLDCRVENCEKYLRLKITRVEGIEPTHTVLKTVVLPLNYTPLYR